MTAPPPITITSYHYARVMHWLRDQLANLKGAAVKLLWEIADRTYGHRKREDVIALSQFQRACGLDRTTVIHTIDDLMTLRLVRRTPAGNSFVYALILPDDIFTAPPVDNPTSVFHTQRDAVSFFAQNSGTCPPEAGAAVEFSNPQIVNVTGNGWKEQEINCLGETLDAINTSGTGYPIRFLPRWVARARVLGMSWGDLWTLWRACVRVGRNPVALFLSRLLGDGTLPTGKRRAARDTVPAPGVYAEFRAMLE